jgi:hypothetical protein
LVLFRILESYSRAPEVTLATVTVSEWWVFVSDAVVLQYVGFESKGAVREYAFTLRGTDGASSQYFVTIANDAFVAHRVRYQDAPDVCSLRLHREFATRTDHPPSMSFSVTDAELADYKDAHIPKSKPGACAHKEDQEF